MNITEIHAEEGKVHEWVDTSVVPDIVPGSIVNINILPPSIESEFKEPKAEFDAESESDAEFKEPKAESDAESDAEFKEPKAESDAEAEAEFKEPKAESDAESKEPKAEVEAAENKRKLQKMAIIKILQNECEIKKQRAIEMNRRNEIMRSVAKTHPNHDLKQNIHGIIKSTKGISIPQKITNKSASDKIKNLRVKSQKTWSNPIDKETQKTWSNPIDKETLKKDTNAKGFYTFKEIPSLSKNDSIPHDIPDIPDNTHLIKSLNSALTEVLNGNVPNMESLFTKLRIGAEPNQSNRHVAFINFEDDTSRPVMNIPESNLKIIEQWYDKCGILFEIENTAISIPDAISKSDLNGILFEDLYYKHKDEFLNTHLPLEFNDILSKNIIQKGKQKYYVKGTSNEPTALKPVVDKMEGIKIPSVFSGVIVKETNGYQCLDPSRSAQSTRISDLDANSEIIGLFSKSIYSLNANCIKKSSLTEPELNIEELKFETPVGPVNPAHHPCSGSSVSLIGPVGPVTSAFKSFFKTCASIEDETKPTIQYPNLFKQGTHISDLDTKSEVYSNKPIYSSLLNANCVKKQEFNIEGFSPAFGSFFETCDSVEEEIKPTIVEKKPTILVALHEKSLQTIVISNPSEEEKETLNQYPEYGFQLLFEFTTSNENIIPFLEQELNNVSFNDKEELNKKLEMIAQYVEFSDKQKKAAELLNNEELHVKQFMQYKYTINDDVNHKMKASTLYDLILEDESVQKSKQAGLRTRLPKYLTDLGLSKKRFNDGFYYYGIVDKYKLCDDSKGFNILEKYEELMNTRISDYKNNIINNLNNTELDDCTKKYIQTREYNLKNFNGANDGIVNSNSLEYEKGLPTFTAP